MARSHLCVVLAALACSTTEGADAPRVTDSLGVTLIDYPTSFVATSDHAWTTDAAPLLSIGETGAELYRVRAAEYLSDGSIVVVNGGTEELLYFDATGRLRRRAGGAGSGPGEFSELTSAAVGHGDSVVAYDARQRRLSVFDRNGTYARAVTLQGLDTLGSAEYVGVLRDGEIVGTFHRRVRGTGLVRDSLLVVRFNVAGAPAAQLGMFPHLFVHWGPHELPGGKETASFPVPVPLSGVTAVGMGDATVVVGIPDPYTVIMLDRDGVRRIIRQRQKAEPITEEHRERLFAAAARGPLSPPELSMLRDLEGPSTLPAFGFEALTALTGQQAVLVTDRGGVWLHPFALPDDSTALDWPRFDADGFYQGTATMPLRFRPTAVRGDVVLGVYQDRFDVEYVRAYRLVGP